MALIALLSARDNARDRTTSALPGRLIEFGGQPLIEFQARIAIGAGAQHVLIQVDSSSPDLSQVIDRLTADRQASIALVQDMATLSRSLVPDDRLILFTENLILPADLIPTLINGNVPALLTLPVVPATGGFERIDGETVWAGAMSVDGRAVLATLGMLGEWDLGLTLLRHVMQNGAQRISLSPELVMDGRLALVRDQKSADVALEMLADQQPSTATGQASLLGRLLAPLAKPIVREFVRRQVEPAQLSIIASVLAVAGVALEVSGFAILAVSIMLIALGLSDIARQCKDVTLRPIGAAWRSRVVPGLALALLALIGWRAANSNILALSGAWTPILLIALLSLLREREGAVFGLWSKWAQLSLPVALIIILVSIPVGATGPAFVLLGLIAVAIVALRIIPETSQKTGKV